MITIRKPTLPDYVSGWHSCKSYDPSSGAGEANAVYCFRWIINGYKFNWTFAVPDIAEMQEHANGWESYWATMFAHCLERAEAQAKPRRSLNDAIEALADAVTGGLSALKAANKGESR